tara:strand:- start:204 stop:557 length:354 start_codon:yes stop_codon:yes gene_type:complete
MSVFDLAKPNLQKMFNGYNSIEDVAKDYYGIEEVASCYFIVFDSNHNEYELRVTNFEMEFGASDIIGNLPDEGHLYTSDNFQDRFFLFDTDVNKADIINILGDVAVSTEKVDHKVLI